MLIDVACVISWRPQVFGFLAKEIGANFFKAQGPTMGIIKVRNNVLVIVTSNALDAA